MFKLHSDLLPDNSAPTSPEFGYLGALSPIDVGFIAVSKVLLSL